MREFKFRAWDKFTNKMVMEGFNVIGEVTCFNLLEQYGDAHPNPIYETSIARLNDFILMQYTGLKDKNGKEIYELMELDEQYRVIWNDCSFVLQDISTGDIIGLLSNSLRRADEREITREYSPVEKN